MLIPCPTFPVLRCKIVRTGARDGFRVTSEGRSDFILNLALPRAARKPRLLTPAMRFIFQTQLRPGFTRSVRVENAKHSRHLLWTAKSRPGFFSQNFALNDDRKNELLGEDTLGDVTRAHFRNLPSHSWTAHYSIMFWKSFRTWNDSGWNVQTRFERIFQWSIHGFPRQCH